MAVEQKYPVVVRTEIDYRRARANWAIDSSIEGWLDRVGTSPVLVRVSNHAPTRSALIADCRQMLAINSNADGKLLRVPDSGKNIGRRSPRPCHPVFLGLTSIRKWLLSLEHSVSRRRCWNRRQSIRRQSVTRSSFLGRARRASARWTTGWGDLYSETDGQYAGAGREMIERVNGWCRLTIGIPRLQKPPLLYWMIAGPTKLFGVKAAAARLPIALAIVATAASHF